MSDFAETESGLIVPGSLTKTEPDARHGFPVKAGWTFSKCGKRYRKSEDETFRMKALEDLYTAVDPGGGRINRGKQAEDQKRCERLLNQLAVELVGGIPEDVEVYT